MDDVLSLSLYAVTFDLDAAVVGGLSEVDRGSQGAGMADAAYFRLAAHEAQALDPQTRLLLEASAEVPPAPPPPSPRVSRLAASYRSTTSIASDETTMRGIGPRGSISDQLPSQDGFLP